MSQRDRYPWLWDVDMDADTFQRVLQGKTSVDGRDWAWALVRLVEYAPYADICKLLPVELFLAHWPQVAPRVRSAMRREGMDYLHATLLEKRRVR